MLTAFAVLVAAQDNTQVFSGWPDSAPVAAHKKERHLANIRQLTFGGQNAEAYWNLEGTQIIFQSTQPGFPDEQIFTMNADGSNKTLMSTGLGRTTLLLLQPGMASGSTSAPPTKRILAPRPRPDMSQGYVWMVNPDFDLYRAKPDGTGIETVITKRGYVAETTISPDGTYMTFTGGFDGDLEIYRSDLDGNNIKRLTHEFGYDGGPFVSWDGKQIVYRRAPLL